MSGWKPLQIAMHPPSSWLEHLTSMHIRGESVGTWRGQMADLSSPYSLKELQDLTTVMPPKEPAVYVQLRWLESTHTPRTTSSTTCQRTAVQGGRTATTYNRRAGGTASGNCASSWGSTTERGSPLLISSRSRETIGDLTRAALRYSWEASEPAPAREEIGGFHSNLLRAQRSNCLGGSKGGVSALLF